MKENYNLYIGGKWVDASSEQKGENINPANLKDIVGTYQKGSTDDFHKAASAANEAKKNWSKLTGNERGNYLFKVADILESRVQEIAEIMTREMGKTLPESQGEINRGVAILRYYAGEGLRSEGDVIPATDREAFMFTTRAPLGVVGVITPWNFPIAIPVWKMAPALIYGNTVVIKPASEAAITCAKLIDCFHEANLPEGVVNMVTGSGKTVGESMVSHPFIHGITFTGSNNVGKEIAKVAAEKNMKYQLEMGGKNPVIVAADADLELAAEATISGGLKSTGQKCTATSRVIVQSEVYEKFKEILLKKVKAITVGNGLDESTWMGPCVSERQLNTVLSYIEKGKKEGAALLFGGSRVKQSDGYFVQPTVFEDVSSDMIIAQEEIFGPVLALIKVETIDEAFKVANDSQFGLSASLFTANIKNMLDFINDMNAGLIRVNYESAGVELQAPFGGMKQSSSHSREQGQAAKEFFTSTKTVFIK